VSEVLRNLRHAIDACADYCRDDMKINALVLHAGEAVELLERRGAMDWISSGRPAGEITYNLPTLDEMNARVRKELERYGAIADSLRLELCRDIYRAGYHDGYCAAKADT
jgi:hypothetical protein